MFYFWYSKEQDNKLRKDKDHRICYVKTHEDEWKSYTDCGERNEPSSKYDDIKLIYRCASMPERRYISVEQDEKEKYEEMMSFLEKCGVTAETENEQIFCIIHTEDKYTNIGVCQHMHQISARSSNGVLAYGVRNFCRRDKNNPKPCIVEAEETIRVCEHYKGEGYSYTQRYYDDWHREALGEFD